MDKPTKNPFKDKLVGRLFMGRYRLVRRLAAGGMGVIYLARAEGAEGFVKPVVVKLIHPHFESAPKFSSMFIREAQIMSNLQHSAIVNVIDFAKEEHTHVMVLEYVSGFQLKQWAKYRRFKGSPLPVEVVIQIMANILSALDYAHTLTRPDGRSMGIVHRDISAANILVDVEGRAKLLDFGIAFVSQGSDGFGTRNTGFKGKLPYSAPELFGGGKASVLSDVYACGVVLHEVLLGKNEFASRDEQEILNRIVNIEPSSVLSARPLAPKKIDDVLRKAMAKKPEDRYQTADDFRRALLEINVEDEQSATALISIQAEQDFQDEMAKYLGVESLADRDRAWRIPSIIPQAAPDTPKSVGAGTGAPPVRVTVPAKPTARAKAHPTPGPGKRVQKDAAHRKKIVFALVALFICVIALGVVILTRSTSDSSEKQIFVVQSPVAEEPDTLKHQNEGALNQVEQDPGDGQDTATSTVPDMDSESAEVSGEVTEDKKPKSPRGGGNKKPSLGSAFRKKKRAVKKCFEQHAMNLDGQPKIFINFEIDETGKVLKSSLSPANIGGTSLGGCLLKVADGTRFSPQNAPVAFRIPVTTWRVTTDE